MLQCTLTLETLENRNTPSCTTAFDPSTGVLLLQCDAADDAVVLSTGEQGEILLNGEAIADGPTIENTSWVVVLGGDGNDYIDLQALAGYAGNTAIYGEAGDDILLGSPVADLLAGGDGSDFLFGAGGDDLILGGLGNDHLDGGAGQDYLLGEEGDDQLLGGGIDHATDYFWGGSGFDLFIIEPTCMEDPEQIVLDEEIGDLFAAVFYFRDPCEDHHA